MSMQMSADELRQLRVWAVETALSKAVVNAQDSSGLVDTPKVLEDARRLVAFVRADP